MAKFNALTAIGVKNYTGRARLADGGGLYLSATGGGKRWTFIFRWAGRRREMGLGSATNVSLAEARRLAAAARESVARGEDPVEQRRGQRVAATIVPDRAVTFWEFAEEFIGSVEAGWRNSKHRDQWRNSLRDHGHGIRDLPVADVSTDDVLNVLRPIWLTKPETASRVRGRIERILAAAKARGLRPTDAANPAQWRGHLELLMPKRPTLSRGHHAAMAYHELPVFFEALKWRPAMAARALEFLILTAGRTGEVLGARWGEIQGDVWSVPADRMKGGRVHTVPLPASAIALLDGIKRGAAADFIFHGGIGSKALSYMAPTMLLRRMSVEGATVHGFRSSFKDWALNETVHPDELSEEALAHIVGSKVRRAYRRGEALERRRALMSEWSDFVRGYKPKGKVEL